MRVKRIAGPAAAVVVLGIFGAGIYYKISGKTDPGADASATTTSTAPGAQTAELPGFNADVPIAVEGTPVVKETLVLGVKASGEAVSPRQIKISSQISAPVRTILVQENSFVQEGQVLIEQDTHELELNLREAEASLSRAQKQFERLMLGQDKVEPAVLEERRKNARIESNLVSAEIQLEKAKINLAKARVTAPASGRVANVMVVPGQTVSSGGELLTIVQIDPIEVQLDVLEGDVGLLENGRGATVTFAGLPGAFTGRITRINPILESRMAKVTVQLSNRDGKILPGMFARANLNARMLENRILVPRTSIVERDGRKLVFVFDPTKQGEIATGAVGRAMWQYVATGLENDTQVELIEDPNDNAVRVLAPGEIVLSAGHTTLPHAAVVQLTENALAAGGRPR